MTKQSCMIKNIKNGVRFACAVFILSS